MLGESATGSVILTCFPLPVSRSRFSVVYNHSRCARSSTDRAPAFEAGGWGFDSLRARQTRVGRLFARTPRNSYPTCSMEVVELEKLRTPITVNAVYILLLGLITLSPGMVSSVFGYAVGDAGVLRVLSGTLLGLGVLLWGIASNVGKYGGLAMHVVIATAIGALWLLWGWAGHLFTLRNAGFPIIINIVLAAWVWSARPKS